MHKYSVLPNSDGPLSKVFRNTACKQLYIKEVKEMLEGDGMVSLNSYNMSGNHTIPMDPMNNTEHFTPDGKATVDKKAAEIGVAATVKSLSDFMAAHLHLPLNIYCI